MKSVFGNQDILMFAFAILPKPISRKILIVAKYLHFYYVEGEIGWNLRRRNSRRILRSRANALESPAELGFHLGDQGENDRQNQMLSVAPHTSVLVIASKIIVRRRISVLPTFFREIKLQTSKYGQCFSNSYFTVTVWKNENFALNHFVQIITSNRHTYI